MIGLGVEVMVEIVVICVISVRQNRKVLCFMVGFDVWGMDVVCYLCCFGVFVKSGV